MVLTELVIGKGEIKIVFNFIFPFIYWKGIEFVLISCILKNLVCSISESNRNQLRNNHFYASAED